MKPESSDQKRSIVADWGLVKKDFITIGISIVALTLSALGTYFSLFRDQTAVSAAILSHVLREEVALDVAVANTGNKQVAITAAEVYVVHLKSNELLRQPLTDFRIRDARLALPLMIEPGKMAILPVAARMDWSITRAYRQPVPVGDDQSHKAIIGVRLNAIGASGVSSTVALDAVELQYHQDVFRGASLDNRFISFQNSEPTKTIRRH